MLLDDQASNTETLKGGCLPVTMVAKLLCNLVQLMQQCSVKWLYVPKDTPAWTGFDASLVSQLAELEHVCFAAVSTTQTAQPRMMMMMSSSNPSVNGTL
jgi:hypothetical protein